MVHQDDGAAVGLAADQPAEALLQPQHRLGEGQLTEGIGERRASRQLQRVARNPEGQSHDHDTRQRITGHVDPLPEAAAAEENAARAFLELRQQLPSRAIEVLRQDGETVARRARPQPVGHIAELLMRGKEHQRAPADRLGDLADHIRDLIEEGRVGELP